MKRFYLFYLLFILLIGLIVFLAMQHCEGAEPRITISDNIPMPAVYPPRVYNMTPAEFFKWATNQNDKALAEWDEWFKTAPPRWRTYDEEKFNGWHNEPYSGSYTRADAYGYRSGFYGGGYGERHYTRTFYTKRYLNPDYVSRPLTIINPYCKPTRKVYSHTTGVWLLQER
jgi:hypothetical protein